MTVYVSQWSEQEVLSYFWTAAHAEGIDRIALLKQLSDVAIARASEWDTWAVRQAMDGVRMTVTADRCFACLNSERRLYWHHVILVKHGGSSHPQNLVSICHACHRRVHPWLEEGTTWENRRGWTWVGDIARVALAKLERAWDWMRDE